MRFGTRSVVAALAAVSMLAGCGEDTATPPATTTTFNVTIENVSGSYDFPLSGAFDTPIGSTGPGAAGPGQSYEFRVGAVPGGRLSFATMFVHSNDLFYAPSGAGIMLFESNGDPVSGDVTDQISLWDAGTEANEEPGVGANQAPRQSAANSGAADGTNTVRLVNDAYSYPAVTDVIRVTVTHVGGNEFTVRIDNVSMETTLMTSMGSVGVPLAPGVFVVHTESDALFSSGSADRGEGLEALAEDGNPAALASALDGRSGLASPLAPGVWVVHTASGPLFDVGQPDRGLGLEALAEDGSAATLAAALDGDSSVIASGAFDTPDGASSPGPATPGSSYSFSLAAENGQRLSFATMFVQSNDLFFAPGVAGIELFDSSGAPVDGDVTSQLQLWDAGTEANQFPGAGPDQAPRQAQADAGVADGTNQVRVVDDGYEYPAVSAVVRVTITLMN